MKTFGVINLFLVHSIPDSSEEFAPNFYLDDIYDGKLNEETKRLEGGLGVLTDGIYGGRVILSDQGIFPGTFLLFKACILNLKC